MRKIKTYILKLNYLLLFSCFVLCGCGYESSTPDKSNHQTEDEEAKARVLDKINSFEKNILDNSKIFNLFLKEMEKYGTEAWGEFSKDSKSISLISTAMFDKDVAFLTIRHELYHYKYEIDKNALDTKYNSILSANSIKVTNKDINQWGQEEFIVDILVLWDLAKGGGFRQMVKYCYLRNVSQEIKDFFYIRAIETDMNNKRNNKSSQYDYEEESWAMSLDGISAEDKKYFDQYMKENPQNVIKFNTKKTPAELLGDALNSGTRIPFFLFNHHDVRGDGKK